MVDGIYLPSVSACRMLREGRVDANYRPDSLPFSRPSLYRPGRVT